MKNTLWVLRNIFLISCETREWIFLESLPEDHHEYLGTVHLSFKEELGPANPRTPAALFRLQSPLALSTCH